LVGSLFSFLYGHYQMLATNQLSNDPIKHVVVLMLENRSFDQMLGAFQKIYPELDGIDPDPQAEKRSNADSSGRRYLQQPGAARQIGFDPNHDLDSVLKQINAPPAELGPDPRGNKFFRGFKAIIRADIGGWWWNLRRAKKALEETKPEVMAAAAAYEGNFVGEFERCFENSTIEERQEIMNYFDVGTLPALHELARNFTICDHWYSSLPGPTWANRIFFHTGTAYGITTMPHGKSDFKKYSLFDQPTIYGLLTAAKRKWRIYFHDFPQSLALSELWPGKAKVNCVFIDEFEKDVAGHESEFPEFVFIEPRYLGDDKDQNDDHPPHDTMLAQELIARIYNGIRGNEELWKSTLFIITYDEHGGFFDHVEPPLAVVPDKYLLEYSFDQLGVRVPAILVSPWVEAGVFSDDLDHTSVGKYLCDKWGLTPIGRRMEQANTFASALTRQTPRDDTPVKIHADPPIVMCGAGAGTPDRNENQAALEALANSLATTNEKPQGFFGKFRKPRSMEVCAAAPEETLKDKARRFLQS
jgi:phospholipase C